MMERVTDPGLIKQLDTIRLSKQNEKSQRQPITDPRLIKQLDEIRLGQERPTNLFKMDFSPEKLKSFQEKEQKFMKEGGLGLAQGVLNIPSGTAELLNPTQHKIPRFNFAPETETSKLGQIASPFVGPQALEIGALKALSLAPKAMNILSKLSSAAKSRPVVNALTKAGKTGAEIGYINALEHPESPQMEFLKGAAIGAPLGALGPLALGAGKYIPMLAKAGIGGIVGSQFGHPIAGAAVGAGIPIRSFLGVEPESKVAEEMLSGLETKDISKSVAANRRLGTNVTPGEASGNYVRAGQEGALKRTAGGGQLGYRLEEKQKYAQGNAINRMLDKIYKPSKANELNIDNLYKKAYQQDVDPMLLTAMMQNPVMRKSIESVQLDPAFADIPPNNYKFLAQVNRDMRRNANALLSSSQGSDRISGYQMEQVRKPFDTFLKDNNPDYKAAAAAAQPKIVRENIETKLNKETEDLTAKTFYSKLLNSRKSYRELLRETNNFPEAQSMIKDMRAGWKNLANMKTTSQSEAQAKSAIDQARNIGSAIVTLIKNISGSRGDIKRLNFIYSPNWEKGFVDIANIKNQKERIKEMINYVSKTSAKAGLASNQVDNLIHMITSEQE